MKEKKRREPGVVRRALEREGRKGVGSRVQPESQSAGQVLARTKLPI